jgi:glycosyltransferase involved in cell wall biosynthesis
MVMSERPAILVVSPTFPYPLVSGGKIRIFNILKQLSLDYNVTLLTLVEAGDKKWLADENLSFLAELITVPIKQNKSAQLWRIFCNLHRWLLGTPAEVLVKHSVKMRAELARLLTTNKFKAVQIEYAQGMWYLPPKLPCPTPVILVAHDVSFISQQRKAQVIEGMARLFWQAEACRMKVYEQEIWRRCDCIITMSDVDRKNVLDLMPTAKVEVVPNGVNIQRDFQKTENKVPTIVFVGWMRHLPNRDGLLWFLEKIWPQISRDNEDVCLQVVGRGVSQSVRNIADKCERAQILGYVDKVEEIVKNAWISVVPIRIGSGSRLKILESMSLNTPVVSTTVGCEGLNVKPPSDISVADQPDEFAGLVLALLKDAKRRRKIAQKARELVENEYTWDRLGIKARGVIEQLISGQRDN